MSYIPHSYQPYSDKSGECLVIGSEGGRFVGLRIESISFPLTINAAQAGICLCLMNGEQPKEILCSHEYDSDLSYWTSRFNITITRVETKQLQLVIEEALVLQQTMLVGHGKELFSPISQEEFGTSEIILQRKGADIYQGKNLPIFTKEHMDRLASKLRSLCSLAICEESHFPVSALIWTELGFFPGVNIEFNDWGYGLCAERMALVSALRFAPKQIFGVFVHAEKGDLSTPCGACRQILNEHMPLAKLYCLHKDETWSEYFIHELLPHAFSSTILSKSRD